MRVAETDVIIVGVGPTGLMLANELRLAGVRALVLGIRRFRGTDAASSARMVVRIGDLTHRLTVDRHPIGDHAASIGVTASVGSRITIRRPDLQVPPRDQPMAATSM